ncbi:hypothetical protein GCM10010345_04370 [Streptomyces canarius]|uniref:Uncharacterized protein n=1 Tax=Streptomyces canarius TaxID=285453 RepID=A0ABQ3CCT3_9ACTN|nr:hypothetical protein GCM10010345_04370 [Streptomyces canarius]
MLKLMTTTDGDGRVAHPGLTISVYRLDLVTGQRTQVRPPRHVPPSDELPLNLAFPPCECHRCAGQVNR